MARVFKIEEWAPAQESGSRNSMSESFAVRNTYTSENDILPSCPPRNRTRLRSLPFVDIANELQQLSLSVNDPQGHTQGDRRNGGLRGLIRRASTSIKDRQRRHSHALEQERPHTAWHRLKTAASFQRPAKLPTHFDDRPVDSHEDLLPTPGIGSAPPIIPRGSGGAARATAAAQNEYWVRSRHLLVPEDFGDRESGIGIALSTTAEPFSYTSQLEIAVDGSASNIPRVDFITQLPAELAIQVLAHLDHHTLRNTASVSKRWAEVSSSSHTWREAFLREKTKAYAMSNPVAMGSGRGVPSFKPENDWKDLYRIRQELEGNWRAGTAQPVYLNGHLDSIYCVQFDETKIITGSRDKTVRVWDLKTFKCSLVIGPPDVVNRISMLIGDDGRPIHHAMLPDQTRLAESTPAMSSFEVYHKQSILCLQYDEDILVTGSSDSTCIVHNIKDGYKPIGRLRHHNAAVLDLAFDERYIVTCSKDNSICVWERKTGVMLKQLRGHEGPVNAVQVRGNTIVSCSGDFKVKLWNIDTGKNIREFTGHTKGLACGQFSEDSRFIASAGNDKIIRIWDANTGECLRRIEAHDNLVRSLHIDSITGRLISGSYDQDIKVFDMESGRVLLDFPKWHSSWVLGAKSDYRRIISTGQDPKILIMDFGMNIEGIEKLESGKSHENVLPTINMLR